MSRSKVIGNPAFNLARTLSGSIPKISQIHRNRPGRLALLLTHARAATVNRSARAWRDEGEQPVTSCGAPEAS
jgi:hypothetical protein